MFSCGHKLLKDKTAFLNDKKRGKAVFGVFIALVNRCDLAKDVS
jgi:hypothetical protein